MIYNRTEADVKNAALLRTKMQSGQTLTEAEREAFERGSCTVNMLNRIEGKTAQMYERLRGAWYFPEAIVTRGWENGEYFDAAQHARLLENVRALIRAYMVYADTPAVPMYLYGYEQANAVERNLHDLETLLDGMVTSYRECGTFECGEENET